MMDAVLDAGQRPRLGRVRRYVEILRSPHVGALVASLAALAPADRHQRAGDRALPARADRLVRGRGRRVGDAGGRLGRSARRAGPARGPARRAPGAVARSRSSTPSRSARSSASPSSARRPSSCWCAASSPASRSRRPRPCCARMWTDLLEPRLHQAAYALDSTMIELIFISGPLLTAVIAARHLARGRADRLRRRGDRPARRSSPRSRRRAHVEPEHAREPQRAARRADVARRAHARPRLVPDRRSASACSRSASPRSAAPRAPPRRAGVLLAIVVVRQRASAACSTARSRAARGAAPHAPARRRAAAADAAPARARARRCAVMALLVIPAGCCIAPLLATRNELVGGVAPPGMRTEAYTWPITAFVGGIAAGAALARRARRGPGLADGVPGRRRLRRGRRAARVARHGRRPCGANVPRCTRSGAHDLTAIRPYSYV